MVTLYTFGRGKKQNIRPRLICFTDKEIYGPQLGSFVILVSRKVERVHIEVEID